MNVESKKKDSKTLQKVEKIWKILTKATAISGMSIIFISHIYTAVVLANTNAMNDNIWTTLSFDLMFFGGFLILWLVAGKGQYGKFFEWVAYLVPMLYNIWTWTWKNEQFDFLAGFSAYFPVNSSLMIIWMIFYFIAMLYLLLAILFGLIKGVIQSVKKKKSNYSSNLFSKSILSKKALVLILPLIMISLAIPMTAWIQDKGNVKRTIILEDTNEDCSLAIWDFPQFTAQVNDTKEIDLTLLSEHQNRTLTAFGKINTTFYGQLLFDTQIQANRSIALMKTLESFNCSACATIWYEDIEDDDIHFPGPLYPENWIGVARKNLEFVIDNNITNVEGICMDSESQADVPPEKYWENVEKYDTFLKEVQTNGSLENPNPHLNKFETVLCFVAMAALDKVDGDSDLVYGSRYLGLPPTSWTQYHFMQYRMHPSMTPTEIYSYNTLSLDYLGGDVVTPTVGLTGVEWFAEGYFEGNNDDIADFEDQEYDYDGIDGWKAMKREILFCKAQGFNQVSVFHLNSYNSPGAVEDYGLLDYYGVEKIEELANEWNQPKTIEYPIFGVDFKLSRGGFYQPFGVFQFDLMVNTEMYVVRWLGIIAIMIPVIFSFKRKNSVKTAFKKNKKRGKKISE